MDANVFRDTRGCRFPVPDADVSYAERISLPLPQQTLLNRLIAEVYWRRETISMWGKTYLQPRLIAWYGDPGATYTYSGLQLEPLPWTSLLSDIKATVERLADAAFNSVLVNYYRDHRDSMGLHSDDEAELGARPIIASLSLGAERTLILKHRRDRTRKAVRLPLAGGSLLVMRGDTQRHWKHGINKEPQPCGPRVNLTFRRIGRLNRVKEGGLPQVRRIKPSLTVPP